MKRLHNIIVPTVTALDNKGNFDPISQNNLIHFLADNGVSGIFALGLTGEFQFLSPELKYKVIDATVQAVEEVRAEGKSIGLVVGVTGQSIDETIGITSYLSCFALDGIVL